MRRKTENCVLSDDACAFQVFISLHISADQALALRQWNPQEWHCPTIFETMVTAASLNRFHSNVYQLEVKFTKADDILGELRQ